TQPSDYSSSSRTLTFGPGVALRTFAVPIVADTASEPLETFSISLSNPLPPNQAVLGTLQKTTVAITDDDPSIQFSSPAYTVSEAGIKATIVVTRTGGSSGTVTVPYTTADGTARVADGDYTAASGTLTFKPGVLSQSFSVPIANDTLDEGGETVNLSLGTP